MTDFDEKWLDRQITILSLMKTVLSRDEFSTLWVTMQHESYMSGLNELAAAFLNALRYVLEVRTQLEEVGTPQEDPNFWVRFMDSLPHMKRSFDDMEMLQRFEDGGPSHEVLRRLLEIGDKLQRTAEDDAFVDETWDRLKSRGPA